MYYPDEIVDEVRARNDIVDVISGYIKLTKKGSSICLLCCTKKGMFISNGSMKR